MLNSQIKFSQTIATDFSYYQDEITIIIIIIRDNRIK